ncbi:MAG TPA: FMN-binding protein [Mesotoga infera]|uniref:FMN-binding protein n=1 Tax=Mesotoga infera TaxID=1236046 RepID=A0A7C1CW70_9BACT|nr:FMN-binding protein [Mesotoga infera]
MRRSILIKVLVAIGIAVAVLLIIMFVFVVPKLEAELKELDTLEFAPLNLADLDDGFYEGSFGAGIVSATVRVAVSGHEIKSIEIVKHNHGRGKPAEEITLSVIENQSVEVDVVSGATYSSKVILKAIENALNR